MAQNKAHYKNPVCEKHKIPVVITLHEKKLGEEWYCEKCKGTPEAIQITV